MGSAYFKKLEGDLKSEKERIALMVIAIAISVVGIGMSLGAYGITTWEIERNYQQTSPASATIEMTRVDAALVDAVTARPGVALAERRQILSVRFRSEDGWRNLLLMVIDDFERMKVSTFRSEHGAWPPPVGTMLVERASAAVLGGGIPDALTLRLSPENIRRVPISGTVHDPGLAPARMEEIVYGYITPQTLTAWGIPVVMEELRVRVDPALSTPEAKSEITALYGWLRAEGHQVHEVQMPPANRHPHALQMETLILLLVVFGFMTLVLSGFLVANLMASLLGKQVRQIAVMKAIGARTGQIAMLYGIMILLPSALAVLLALAPGWLAAKMMADVIAAQLNFNIESYEIPAWVYATQFASGLLIPLLAAAVPIARASRASVAEALLDYGVNPIQQGNALFRGVAAFGRNRLNRIVALVLKNTFRKQGRLALTLVLLATGGAMFMSSINMADGWRLLISQVFLTRNYDVELRLSQPRPVEEMTRRLKALPGVAEVEGWVHLTTAVERIGDANLVTTYPDGGHGSFSILGPPVGTRMVSYPLRAGRWLLPDDRREIVVNQMVLGIVPKLRVGDELPLSLGGKLVRWRVVGIVETVAVAATAYISPAAVGEAAGVRNQANLFRISTPTMGVAEQERVIREIEEAMTAAGIGITRVVPLKLLNTAMGEHVYVLMGILIAMAVIMAIVGAIGLLASQGMNTLERTRELGVMRAIGGTSLTVQTVVISEGVLTSTLSWVLALGLSIPFSEVIGRVVGNLAFQMALPRSYSPGGMVIWLVLVLGVSIIASVLPAWRASRISVSEALAYP